MTSTKWTLRYSMGAASAALIMAYSASAIAITYDDVLGKWETKDEHTGAYVSTVEFKKNPKNGTYYAQVIDHNPKYRNYRENCDKCPKPFTGKPIKGIVMIWNMKPVAGKPGEFDSGYGINPWTGQVFQGSAVVTGNILRLRGGLLGAGWLGKNFTWTRSK